jgi:hypothetical protein
VTDLLLQRRLLALQLADLRGERLVGRVVGGVLALDVRHLHAQVLDLRVQRDGLVEQALGLQADVDRVCAHLEGVQRGGRLLQVHLDLGQLLADELQAVGRFGRVAVHVLLHVQRADLVQKLGGEHRVRVVVGQGDDARVLGRLHRLHRLLQQRDGVQVRMPRHVEHHARVGVHRLHLHGDAVAGGRLPDVALQQRVAVIVGERVGPVLAGDDVQLLVQQRRRHVELEHVEFRAAPVVAAHAQERRRHVTRHLRVVVARHVAAEYRELLRLHGDVELEVVHRLPDHRARSDQGDLGGGLRGGGAERLRQVVQAGQAGYLLFHLHGGGGFVDRRGQHHVQHAES